MYKASLKVASVVFFAGDGFDQALQLGYREAFVEQMQYHRTGGNEVAQVLESFVYYFIVVESQGRQLVVNEPFGPRGIVAGQQVVVRLAYQCQESHGYYSTARSR